MNTLTVYDIPQPLDVDPGIPLLRAVGPGNTGNRHRQAAAAGAA
jgi:hypothetical protein